MLVGLSPDQELFRETTERFLRDQVPPDRLRGLRHDPAGFSRDYWRRGAEMGWTSLLVDEAQGGGTISGAGLVDLSLVAHEFGRHGAPGPLVPSNVVAATLAVHRTHPDVLAGLLDGSGVATWCAPAPPPEPGRWRTAVEIDRRGPGAVLRGEVRPVESAGQADHLLVTGRDGSATTQLLVPTSTRGVSIRPMETVDLTRRFDRVILDDVALPAGAVVGVAGEAAPDVERQFRQALTLLDAEAVGAMQAAFDMTLAWAFDRYTFGRPLASYQALKHRFADMLCWLEASHAISDAACAAVEAGSPDADELSSIAKAYIGQYGAEVLQDCVQIHGGIGVTFEHDLHLFLRRFTVNRSLAGTPADHRQRVAALVGARVGDAA